VTTDAQLCLRVRAGEPSAVRELLEREHPVAAFFARVVAPEDRPDRPDRMVAVAWERLLAGIMDGTVTDGLRAALLSSVAAALKADEDAKGANPAKQPERPALPGQLGTFAAAGDRWEGWWQDEPPAWPPEAVPQPDQVLRALRRLSPEQRAVLVLRDVAGLPAPEAEAAAEAAAALDGARDLDALLISARDAYLVELDREVGGR
jgi:hypothetical protein